MNEEARQLGSSLVPGKVFLLEAAPGAARGRFLEELSIGAADGGARTWLLDCGFHRGGLWAGVNELFRTQIREIQKRRPDLVQKHDYELVCLLPELHRSVRVRNPTLTDTATDDEKVRNYPADRAFRIVHGLIDLLAAWKEESAADQRWVIVLNSFDEASQIGLRFFRELARRRAGRLSLAMVTAIPPDGADRVRSQFRPELLGIETRIDLPADPPFTPDPEAAARAARELEQLVGDDRIEIEIHIPRLIDLWKQAGHSRYVLRWRLWALETYNTRGFYEDALVYGEGTLEEARRHAPENEEVLWSIFVKLFMSLVGLRRAEEARGLAMEVLARPMEPGQRGRLCYLMAMLWARYLRERDLAKGEAYLDEGLRLLQAADLPSEELHFQTVFNRNGLAMIRTFQGRFEEALELCQAGYQRLATHLAQDRHRLHRSVLLYNIARVYTMIGAADEAIRHFDAAIEMDPHYSEYYNDRGSTYLKIGRLQEALTDFLTAVELSPPYHEVYTNLGHCHRLLGSAAVAVDAYSISLDVFPDQPVTLFSRAQAYEALGDNERALGDYDASLAGEPGQWQAHAARAVLRYEKGQLAASLDDLNTAIQLYPNHADLYSNRALVLKDLGCFSEAANDLSTYLDLAPDAPDRSEAEQRLQELDLSIRLSA
jgi:tetratricopeptide (TPR) repeat protein